MRQITRRELLRSAGGLGLVSLAGCVGSSGNNSGNSSGGSGGITSISVGIPSASTTAGAASNSFQRVVQNVSPNTGPAGTIQWNNQETGGDPPSIRQYSRGNLGAFSATNFAFSSAKQDLPPFSQNPIESLPYQGLSYATLDLHILATDDSQIQTTDDLPGSKFWPLPPQWGLRQLTETVFKNANLWSELQNTDSIVNTGTDGIASAIQEGNANALVAYGATGVNLAGWATEVDARSNLHLVEMTDNFKQGIKDTRGIVYEEREPYGWENQNFTTDQMQTYGVGYQFWLGKDISRDVGYELTRIANENVQALREGQPAFADLSDPAVIKSRYIDSHPVHPGPYDFMEENGVDLSSYSRGNLSNN